MAKKLVAYFSAGGTTRKVAHALASAIGADEFAIVPEKPYTEADLKWTNPLARCNREKFGRKDVPIAGRVENFGDYDTVFLGFPIWYYSAPNIVATFLKSYDWAGRKIALFATSGGSDIGKTAEKLRDLHKGEVVAAKLFRPDAGTDELKTWAQDL